MEQAPIQTWEFMDYSNLAEKIAYCGETTLLYRHYNKDKPRVYSTHSIFIQPYCLSNYHTECLILKYIAERHEFDPKKLSKKQRQHWLFWKFLDLSKLPTINCLAEMNKQKLILELSPKGARGGRYNSPSNIIYSNDSDYRLDNLFFDGPKIPNLSLKDRKKLRQGIFDAISPSSGLSINDAFPLFDYDKISSKTWEYTNEDGISGEFLGVYNNYITIAGWDNPREGGSADYSIEEIWTKRPNFVGPKFVGANEFIQEMFSQAIIKES